jgi:adenosylhomocysteine nucleosidase
VTTGIIIALPEELSTLTAKKIAPGECSLISENILVAHAGTGPANAIKATEALLANGSCKLISWGCAGALDSTLNAGDLCMPKIIIAENRQHYSTHSDWHQHTVNILSKLQPIYSAPLSETSSIVSTSVDKKALHDALGSIALDMESAAIAKIAQKADIPYLVIRTIADTANMNMPEAVNFALNNEGSIDIKKLIIYLLTHPNEIPCLIKLGIAFRSARKKLKYVAQTLESIINFPATQEHQLDTCLIHEKTHRFLS